MGGVGKTELALQYALDSLEKETYKGGIAWFNAQNDIPVGVEILQFAQSAFNLNYPTEWTLQQKLHYCWQCWRKGDVLFIFDDVRDYENIQPYLPPPEKNFKIIITTRKEWLATSIESLHLEVLSETAAIDLLVSFIGEARVNKQKEEAKKLCQWLGYLPLGLELVGRFLIRRKTWSLTKMKQRLEAQQLDERTLKDTSADMTAKRGVAAAFEISWQELEDNTIAQQLACYLSLFALSPIPWYLVENSNTIAQQNPDDLEDIREDFLINLNLLQEVLDKEKEVIGYQLHSLIRQFLRAKLAASPQEEEYKTVFCETITAEAKIDDTPTQADIQKIAPVTPHLTEIAENKELHQWLADEDVILVWTGLGRYYQGQGLYNQALPWYQECVEITKQRLGEKHPYVATSLNNLALLYDNQGKYEEAEPLYLQALALRREILGEKHPDVATSLHNLAELYRNQGKYEEAEPLYQQALALRREILGEKHPSVATSLHNLAGLYRNQGKYEEAEPLYLQALAIAEEVLGANHPSTNTFRKNLISCQSCK